MIAADILTIEDLLLIRQDDLVNGIGIAAGTERRIIGWLVKDYGYTPPAF